MARSFLDSGLASCGTARYRNGQRLDRGEGGVARILGKILVNSRSGPIDTTFYAAWGGVGRRTTTGRAVGFSRGSPGARARPAVRARRAIRGPAGAARTAGAPSPAPRALAPAPRASAASGRRRCGPPSGACARPSPSSLERSRRAAVGTRYAHEHRPIALVPEVLPLDQPVQPGATAPPARRPPPAPPPRPAMSPRGSDARTGCPRAGCTCSAGPGSRARRPSPSWKAAFRRSRRPGVGAASASISP